MKTKNLLIIFTRNPELGKCKTRLAKTIGDTAALEVYKFLLDHTVTITKDLEVDKHVYYSEAIRENDIWNEKCYTKKKQEGDDLGERMYNAFKSGFDQGYSSIIIIGSDMFDLSQKDLENAFDQLKNSPYIIGPALDGGYYLLGMNSLNSKIFKQKQWGTATVLKDTLQDLNKDQVTFLPERNDIDTYEDIKNNSAFKIFLQPK
ncbi:TIGR04282 family arsenosugar biosynthesis glycosyltransferase [Aquimarina brevivitae]|uniref:Glycosyltransferase A (GT-A) superfamily protein (DUF2064 family) n=1 Tax=Aquimarina brevivitae TaxID=323412 RepID=A0A4Q7PH98_9FLAO|nr:hypothetical protein EV197_1001 [Aquimarina brevivitae]